MHILYHEARFKEYINKLLHHMLFLFFLFFTLLHIQNSGSYPAFPPLNSFF